MPKSFFQSAYLHGQCRLRKAKLFCRTRQVSLMRDGAKIAKMAKIQAVHASILSNEKIDTMYFIYVSQGARRRIP
jgi:hypothetical protein